jgi:hypothetical protein
LHIALQNIGGFPTKHNDIKEDYIRHGLNNWDIDIFGLVETNLDWPLQSEEINYGPEHGNGGNTST